MTTTPHSGHKVACPLAPTEEPAGQQGHQAHLPISRQGRFVTLTSAGSHTSEASPTLPQTVLHRLTQPSTTSVPQN
jgi:hypothetical protein